MLFLFPCKKLKLLVELVIFVNIFFKCVNCVPLSKGSYINKMNHESYFGKRISPKIQKSPSDNLFSYLTSFGYLPESIMKGNDFRKDDNQLRNAIKKLQAFGNINVTGILDAKTKKLMDTPRCGMPEPPLISSRRKRSSVFLAPKWNKTYLTWRLGSSKNETVRRVLTEALAIWARHSKLVFQEIDYGPPDILIEFKRGEHGDGKSFDGVGGVLAHAFAPGDGIGGDAHFDEEENWLLQDKMNGNGISLFWVAAHEFGHSLGLSHSPNSKSLMFPWYTGIFGNHDLPIDDQCDIQKLFGSKQDEKLASTPEDPKSPDNKAATISQHRDHPSTAKNPKRTPKITRQTATVFTTTSIPNILTKKNHSHHFDHPYPYDAPTTSNLPVEAPIACDTSYDAVAVIRGETYIFKKKYVWRFNDNGLVPGSPSLTNYFWQNLPRNFSHIDAAYETLDQKIVFFIGKMYYVYDNLVLMKEYPKPLTHLGLPASLEKIDAAFIWGYNSRTYFISGTEYWKFDERLSMVELDYPRSISFWCGINCSIDAAFKRKDGKTYFFQGKVFWKVNDETSRHGTEKRDLTDPFWMGCPRRNSSVKFSSANSSRKLNVAPGRIIFMLLSLYSYVSFLSCKL